LFLKSSLGVKSEHRFQDTVEEHVFPHFSADARPAHSRSQFQGFRNTAAYLVRMGWNTAGMLYPKTSPCHRRVKMGGRKPGKRLISAPFQAMACRFTYL